MSHAEWESLRRAFSDFVRDRLAAHGVAHFTYHVYDDVYFTGPAGHQVFMHLAAEGQRLYYCTGCVTIDLADPQVFEKVAAFVEEHLCAGLSGGRLPGHGPA